MAAPPDQQASPNQQSLVLDCSVCAEQYGPSFSDQPRSLRCGHTFCTACLLRLITSRGIICPMCNQLHPLMAPDVTLVSINYAVMEIVKNMNAQNEIMTQPSVPVCFVCKSEPTTMICVDCDPGNHYNFCKKCDIAEHTRSFVPVQRHRRFPIGSAPIPNSSSVCPRHLVTATLFSEGLNELACPNCQTEDDWQSRVMQFELLPEATERLRVKIQKLNKYTSDMNYKLRESKMNLETIINDLEPSAVTVKAKIAETFSKCVEVLQERQKTLLDNVDVELKNRKECLKKQLDAVNNASTKFKNAYQNLNALIGTGTDFIASYRISVRDIESSLDLDDDRSLLRPLVNQEIPFCMSKDIEKQLQSLGAVGGGASPIELDFAANGAMGTLMQLYWQLPERCDKVHRFQIEYEQVIESNIERRDSGLVDNAGDKVYIQKEPQYYEVPGNELTAYVDYLCPGYTFRFRIRSANDAGFGMWSDLIVAETIGFPFTLEYTKRIHRIIIPSCNHYRITVKGAKAADGMIHEGGKGAIISAVVSLKAGDVLILLCGGMSSRHHYHSGGGGGSFVALNEISQESLFIAAGGGGGTRGADQNDFNGSDASVYEDGIDGLGNFSGAGGKNGGPGEDAKDSSNADELWSWGGGGAGFMQDSTTALGFVAGGHGGQNGGFGGGGSVGMYGGGGGGGYSGGGGGRGGGGGGSYVISSAVEVSRSVGNNGHGSICIEKVDPPYPVSNSFSRGMSTGGDSTGNSNSATQLNGTGAPFDMHFSSSSFNTTRTTTSTSNGTSSINISTIPENESGSSPVSTGQVSTGQIDFPDEVTFTIDPDDVSTAPPTLVSEFFNVVMTPQLGGSNSEEATNYPRVKQYQAPSSKQASEEPYSYQEGVSNFMAKSAPSVPSVTGGDMQQQGVPQNLPNVSPPLTRPQAGDDLGCRPEQSVEALQAQLQHMQQQLFQLKLKVQQQQQQKQQQQQQQSQPVHQVVSLQQQNFSPPMTTQQQTSDPAMVGQQQDQAFVLSQLQQTEKQLLQLQQQQQQVQGVPQPRKNVSPPMSQYPQQEMAADTLSQPVHPGVPQQWQNVSPPTTTQQQPLVNTGVLQNAQLPTNHQT